VRTSILFFLTTVSTAFPTAFADEDAATPNTFEIEAAYTGEVWSNKGGLKDGGRYLDNLGLSVTADLGRLAGWRGAKGHASILYNNGSSLSELTGDSLVVSNIEAGVEALRLYEAWIEAPVSSSSTLKVGLYDLNSEFDVLESSALFIGSAHGIGMDIAQTGQNGPSIFPITGLAARLDFTVSENLTFRVAALEGVPGDPDNPASTVIDLDGDEGVLIIGEFALNTDRSRVLLGAWGYSEEFERFDGRGTAPSSGIYLRGERLLAQKEFGDVRGFARLGLATGDVNPYNAFVSGGLTLETAASGSLGIAVAYAGASDRYRDANVSSAAGETVVELTYAYPLTDWLELQPNIQFISNPSADRSVDDAVAFGFRFTVSPQF
jgi:porin